MKRLLIGFLLVIALVLAAIYILIPSNLTISKVMVARCIPEATNRLVLDTNNWKKWWPSPQRPGNSGAAIQTALFINNNDTFKITHRLHSSLDILMSGEGFNNSSRLTVFPVSADTVALQWQSELQTGLHPFKKIMRYQQALRIKRSMTDILDQLKVFLENKDRVYGMNIQKTSTTDTLLVATKAVLTSPPATKDIYYLVERLQKYIQKQGAKQTGSPMMNVSSQAGNFVVMVAIPTNAMLSGEDSIFFRKMVPGNFLVANVRGGDDSIEDALQNFRLYAADHKKTLMAIPFQTLITDRRKEPDSLKWLTKVYYPVDY